MCKDKEEEEEGKGDTALTSLYDEETKFIIAEDTEFETSYRHSSTAHISVGRRSPNIDLVGVLADKMENDTVTDFREDNSDGEGSDKGSDDESKDEKGGTVEDHQEEEEFLPPVTRHR